MKRGVVNRKSSGFTLVELIVTLTILAVVSVGIFGFIESSASGYVESRDREALQSEARFAVERLGRELRHAVPNSLELEDGCLTYTPIHFTGIYNQLEADTNTLDVSLSTTAAWQDKVSEGGYRLVFLPSSPNDMSGGNSFAVTGVAGNVLTVDKDPTADWPAESPSKRFYLYKHAVEFCFAGDALTRRVDANGSSAVPLAQQLAPGSHFELGTDSLSGSNLVNIHYQFSQSGETSTYIQQVQVLNAP